MTTLDVLRFPDPRLRVVADPVPEVTDATRSIVADMLETMYDEFGIGLAASQVNIPQRIIVMDLSENGDQPVCLINPEITHREGEREMQEGCLSVPEFNASVKRADRIHCCALNERGEATEFDADGLLSVCVQHEIDHLDGVLFIDHLSGLRRQLLRGKLRKLQQHSQ